MAKDYCHRNNNNWSNSVFCMKKIKRSIDVVKWALLIVAALSSALFIMMVHWYNIPMWDDYDFMVHLRSMTIWEHVAYEWTSFCGRFWGQFLNGIFVRLYETFGTLMVGAMLVYILEIFLIEQTLVRLLRICHMKAIIYSVILLGLYISMMHSIHSYFWMCTQGYSLRMCVTLFTYAYIREMKVVRWYDYVASTVLFSYLGAGYEIFSPCVLVFVGIRLLMYWIEYKSLKKVFTEQTLLVYGFIIATISFFIMIAAPGNWVRMDAYEDQHVFSLIEFMVIVVDKVLAEVKAIVLRLPYMIAGFVMLLDLTISKNLGTPLTSKQVLLALLKWLGILFGMVILAFVLETYAIGNSSLGRALCFIPMFLLFFIGVMVVSVRRWISCKISKNTIGILTCFVAITLIICNIYAIVFNSYELQKWQKEETTRLEYLQQLNNEGFEGLVLLKPIYEPECRCFLDDNVYKRLIPKFTRKKLLNVTQFYPPHDLSECNVSFVKYHHFNFSIAQDTIQ